MMPCLFSAWPYVKRRLTCQLKESSWEAPELSASLARFYKQLQSLRASLLVKARRCSHYFSSLQKRQRQFQASFVGRLTAGKDTAGPLAKIYLSLSRLIGSGVRAEDTERSRYQQ